MAEGNFGLNASLPGFNKSETVSSKGRDVRLSDTVEHVHLKPVYQSDCPEHTPYKQSKLDIIKQICDEEFLLDCCTEKCIVDYSNVVSLPKPVGSKLLKQQDPSTCASSDLTKGTYISSLCASVLSSQNFQKCHLQDTIPPERHQEEGPTVSVVQHKTGNSDMPVLGKCNNKVTEISFRNSTSELDATSQLLQVTSLESTSSFCLSNQPSGYVTSDNKFSGRPRSCFAVMADFQHKSQKEILSDQGDSTISTGSSCQEADSQREESVMDHECLESRNQFSQFSCNCNSDSPADQETCVHTYLHGDNELDDLLYHFEIFFQNRFDSELQHFQENVFVIMQEQQSHVRQIVHAAIMEHNSQSCCAADDVQHTASIESKPDHTTNMSVVGTSRIPEIDVAHLSLLAQLPHCNRTHSKKAYWYSLCLRRNKIPRDVTERVVGLIEKLATCETL